MKIKFTNEEFEKCKADEKLKIECYNCNVIFFKKKKYVKQVINKIKRYETECRFCSLECSYKYKEEKIYIKCTNCNEEVTKRPCNRNTTKSGNLFCSSSCSASYNNKNKKYGTRRSKMEIWIEECLKNKYKDLEIIFNGKEAINSELDIYIPSLKLAVELNGIFHYEPIYGDKKLESVQNNDNRKFQACLEKGIEFCTIDISSSKHFKPERDKKYLDIIEKIIEMKTNTKYDQNQDDRYPNLTG